MKFTLTAAEKRARKERKRICKIQRQISNQSATFKFYDLYEIDGDDGSIKKKEIEAAKEKIAALLKKI
jgi:hypothetical protein